jgi:hypothetical protein
VRVCWCILSIMLALCARVQIKQAYTCKFRQSV